MQNHILKTVNNAQKFSKLLRIINILIIYSICTLLYIFPACTKQFDYQSTITEDKYFVDALISNGNTPRVYIAKLRPYGVLAASNDDYKIDSAEITITDNLGNKETVYKKTTQPYFMFNNILGKAGVNYFITIKINNYTATAQTSIPDSVNVASRIEYSADNTKFSFYYPVADADAANYYYYDGNFSNLSKTSAISDFQYRYTENFYNGNDAKNFNEFAFRKTDIIAVDGKITGSVTKFDKKTGEFLESVKIALQNQEVLFKTPSNFKNLFNHDNITGAFVGCFVTTKQLQIEDKTQTLVELHLKSRLGYELKAENYKKVVFKMAYDYNSLKTPFNNLHFLSEGSEEKFTTNFFTAALGSSNYLNKIIYISTEVEDFFGKKYFSDTLTVTLKNEKQIFNFQTKAN